MWFSVSYSAPSKPEPAAGARAEFTHTHVHAHTHTHARTPTPLHTHTLTLVPSLGRTEAGLRGCAHCWKQQHQREPGTGGSVALRWSRPLRRTGHRSRLGKETREGGRVSGVGRGRTADCGKTARYGGHGPEVPQAGVWAQPPGSLCSLQAACREQPCPEANLIDLRLC